MIEISLNRWCLSLFFFFLGLFQFDAVSQNKLPQLTKEQTKQVEELTNKGNQFFNDGKFEEVLRLLSEAYNLYPTPSIIFNIARVYEAKKDYIFAREFFIRALSAGAEGELKKKVEKKIKEMEKLLNIKEIDQPKNEIIPEVLQLQKAISTDQINNKEFQENLLQKKQATTFGKIKINTNVLYAKVWIDGVFMGALPLDPFTVKAGKHFVEVKHRDYKTWSEEISINSDEELTIRVELLPIVSQTAAFEPKERSSNFFYPASIAWYVPLDVPIIENNAGLTVPISLIDYGDEYLFLYGLIFNASIAVIPNRLSFLAYIHFYDGNKNYPFKLYYYGSGLKFGIFSDDDGNAFSVGFLMLSQNYSSNIFSNDVARFYPFLSGSIGTRRFMFQPKFGTDIPLNSKYGYKIYSVNYSGDLFMNIISNSWVALALKGFVWIPSGIDADTENSLSICLGYRLSEEFITFGAGFGFGIAKISPDFEIFSDIKARW